MDVYHYKIVKYPNHEKGLSKDSPFFYPQPCCALSGMSRMAPKSKTPAYPQRLSGCIHFVNKAWDEQNLG